MDRDQGFRVRLTAEERAMLRTLAEAQGLSCADVVRLLLRREYGAVVVETSKRAATGRS